MIDSTTDLYLRVNACVTEERNLFNVPQMMYTPNKENYVQSLKMNAGLKQKVDFHQIEFDLNYLVAFELFKVKQNYFPLVISVNYQNNGKPIAFINYGVF